ncbi:uncharacterized protein PFL1_06903 [Pseudozyma flocculosa PF-1]|uniref:Uncharacterized protein n=1 Tax=Pseudozyma flocculosa PF-1 TaxID=1277687 RepID=A0A061H1X9_9BASI|nr:uncharacterized protein PFL1_06903 [Pseudozyma flocculosa PF-1]EPQ26677.1 hypothetical protein PFL1_06903 [Pseudozyma flocculosa PF-1]
MGITRYINPTAIPPLIIFTALSSFAFNNSLLVTARADEERRTALLHSLLDDIVALRRNQLRSLSSIPLRSQRGIQGGGQRDEDGQRERERERELTARLASVHPDVTRFGLVPPASSLLLHPSSQQPGSTATPGAAPGPGGMEEITWTQIFFGKRGETSKRFRDVVDGIRASFTLPSSPSSLLGGSGSGGTRETTREQEERLRRQREEEERLLASWREVVGSDLDDEEGKGK